MTRNKVSFFNARLKLDNGQTNPMTSSIAELNEIIDAMTIQVNFFNC